MKEEINTQDFIKIVSDICASIEKQKDYLSELDRAIGDGDHGVTMSIGWTAVKEKLSSINSNEGFQKICTQIASSFLSAVGASAGPLYATALMRGGIAIKDKEFLDAMSFSLFLDAAAKGIKDRGKAEIGDKTMLDVWMPAAEEMKKQANSGANLMDALDSTVKNARNAMNKTKDLLSKKGRSSKLGKRSIGHIDPGAASSFVIINSIYQTLKNSS
jgi:dihydroxyacetone kinase phosphoprotein-dependent L subunit|tara:strand:+ start:252 stop:899 length:648 start_codon:yes stop_codon:yes gene_type:complete